ncbi:MAG: hypothetical protein ACI36Z_10620 [Alloprevotella sp.]
MKLSIVALLGAAALVAGCSDDDFGKHRPAVQGDEVHFGASAYFEQAPTRSSRTEYGDIANGQVELKWVAGDKIDIACPQATAGRRKAAYEVVETSIIGDDNSATADNSVATELQKLGEYGIQWGEPGVHDFYATYPSSQSFTDAERGKIGLDGSGLNGYLPVEQNPKSVTTSGDVTVVNPDMRYAFMVSDKTSYDSSAEGGEGVSLTFKPLVTALEFQVAGPTISGDNTSAPSDITVTEVSLYSVSGANICGNFQYKYADGTLTETNDETGYSRITMTMPDGGVTLTNRTKMDFTFFVLPTAANIASKDLKLQIFYQYNGSPFVKTLTIAKEITPKKKYFFKNIALPDVDSDIDGSAWFSALAPNIYLSQISIPVAGNSFSSYYSGSDEQYYKEQSLHYTALWNKGVRGFEFSTSYGTGTDNSTSGTLADNRFVCNGKAMDVKADDGTAVTFGNAFKRLASQLDVDAYKNECLIVICTYKSYTGDGGSYSPQSYITCLEQFLTDNTDINNKLVKLTPNSTVSDLRGHIAIIVRPGDDQNVSTQNLEITNSKLTLVKDWGTAVDKWDKRFGSGYCSEGAFSNVPTNAAKVENYLWGASSSDANFTVASHTRDFVEGYPTVNDFQFDHTTETSGQNVHVQEWARIVPSNSFATNKFYSGLSQGHEYWTGSWPLTDTHYSYLWLKWPESYSQKQEMITQTVATSMATMGGSTENKLFINSLCGFYPAQSLSASFYPYNSTYSYQCTVGHATSWLDFSFTLSNAGAGGDYVTCAYDLNKWFYNWLTTENTQQGPLGLVMLNHIGTTSGGSDDKSLDLVHWIMMNNFKFPLATNPNVKVLTSNDPADPYSSID